MTRDTPSTRFEQTTTLAADSPTLIEGLPGLGLVASIAVDQVTEQLALEQHGTVVSDDFPPVAAFDDGRIRDAIRVYAGADPAVMTLQSDVPIPPETVESLSQCVLNDLAAEFERAVFLAGAPASSDERVGEVVGVATTDGQAAALDDAGIALAEGAGVIGGVTGALLADCYHNDVPAVVLVVRSNPYIPDPEAARAVVENALEPLVDFDIDTEVLRERGEEIRRRKQQIAEQLEEYRRRQEGQPRTPSMYQ